VIASQTAKYALRGINRNKLRSALMMLGVAVGVASLTVVTALGKSTIQGVMDSIESTFSANNIYIAAGGGAIHGGGRGDGPTTTLTIDDVDAIEALVPNVDVIAPSVRAGNLMVTYKGVNREVRITGHALGAELLYRRAVRGSFFGPDDLENASRVAIIGQDAAAGLFGGIDPIGEQVRIGTVPFEIIGVLEEGGVDIHSINRDDEIFVPLTTAMRRLMNVDHINAARLHVQDGSRMQATADAIATLLRERHMIGPGEPDDFMLVTPVQVQEMVASSNKTLTLFLPLISAIAIVAGALSIASLMLVAVNERRPEIGLRKAVGARPKDIQTQFLIEAMMITVVAGAIGLLVGGAGSQIMLSLQDKPLALPWGGMGIGLATSIGVGLVAGVIPARRAAALDPVDALQCG